MIEFNDGNGNWIMRLDNGKILFNRKYWPDATPDDFAISVIEVLEKATVRMENWDKIKPITVEKEKNEMDKRKR